MRPSPEPTWLRRLHVPRSLAWKDENRTEWHLREPRGHNFIENFAISQNNGTGGDFVGRNVTVTLLVAKLPEPTRRCGKGQRPTSAPWSATIDRGQKLAHLEKFLSFGNWGS